MFWLLKKLLTLVVFVGLILVILNLDYKGRPVRDYAAEFLKAPLIQEISRQAKQIVVGYLHKDLKNSAPAMEKIEEQERQELEKVIEHETEKK